MSAKHTPGPWFIISEPGSKGDVRHAGGFIAFPAFPRHVSDDRIPGESWLQMRERTEIERVLLDAEREANARLIAAAPDLLDLLIELTDIEGPMPGTATWGKKALAAIAKATGEGKP